MELALSVAVAVGLGVLWVLVLRRSPRRRRIPGAPREVGAVLDDYRRRRWSAVAEGAPKALARPGDGGDATWRPAVELALGHALAELDRPADAVPHLERGLLLQAALRRSSGETEAARPDEAKLRHLLGWSYAATGHTAQARREYRRVLDTPGLAPEVRRQVEGSVAALDRGGDQPHR